LITAGLLHLENQEEIREFFSTGKVMEKSEFLTISECGKALMSKASCAANKQHQKSYTFGFIFSQLIDPTKCGFHHYLILDFVEMHFIKNYQEHHLTFFLKKILFRQKC